MSNAEELESQPQQGSHGVNPLEIRVPARLENLAVLRTVIGAVATFEDLDLDSVADLRLATDEACTRLIRCADAGATLLVVIDADPTRIKIEVSTAVAADDVESVLPQSSFSWHVLTSLTDDIETFHRPRDGHDGAVLDVAVALTTRRVSPER